MQEKNKFADLRIENDSGRGVTSKVYLNGEDIARFTRSITLNVNCNEPVTATIEIYVSTLDVKTKALIQGLIIDPNADAEGIKEISSLASAAHEYQVQSGAKKCESCWSLNNANNESCYKCGSKNLREVKP